MKTPIGEVSDAPNTHLLVLVVRGEKVVAQQVLDLARGGHRPLLKELAYRAVATDPAGLAGQPWQVHLDLEGVGTDKPCLRCEARLKHRPQPRLTVLPVPVGNFAWVGVELANELKIKDYSVHVAVPDRSHPLVERSSAWEDEDFAVSFDDEPELLLPSGFSTEPLGPRRVIARAGAGTWLKCVFEPGAWDTFLTAAGNEREVERGWLATARMHLADGACSVVLERLDELPAEARGEYYLHTKGRAFYRLHRRLGGKLGGYLHLHPREADGTPLSPAPSGPDVTVAWNVEAASTLVPVFPIAMFGARPETCGTDVAAHAFVSGVIGAIDLEVVQ
jgi:hypothetical protein